MLVIKNIDVLSAGKIGGILYAFFGLLGGIFLAISIVVTGETDMQLSPMMGFGLGLLAIVLLPIFYGVMGFLAGVIGAFLYNFSASWVGGIKIDTKKHA